MTHAVRRTAVLDKSYHQQQVEAFMLRGGQQVPLVPTVPTEEVRLLRAKLIMEEALETIGALGVHVVSPLPRTSLIFGDLNFVLMSLNVDLADVADGCCDLRVVTTGTLSACGLPDVPFQAEVDHNNLLKFGPGCIVREDGKIIKPPDHQPPRLGMILSQIDPNW